ncbi:LOW QUALITY PROTEIN: hypothetical protein RJ640_009690, partial [Escallonia rubra]
MDPSELKTQFKIMDTMSSDQTSWSFLYPNPCKPGSSWVRIECKPGTDNHVHVTRLVFGTPPNPTYKNTSTFPSQIFGLPYLRSAFFFNWFFIHTKTTITLFFTKQTLPCNIAQSLIKFCTCRLNPASNFFSKVSSNPQILQFAHCNIPNQLGSLRNLEGLDLIYNSLTHLISYTVGRVCFKNLSSNSLVRSIPNTIEKLNSLVFMALRNNKLRGELFFSQIQKPQKELLCYIKYFIMDDNP